ncbi:hypothetical protein QT972_00060 [Microcoleus sp. herbarium7]|uniref:hypothetical protein n=1 Tax=Microcoleus sp. herbarium7 TaxID=3055435 RepID=UPI002FD47ECB
MTTFKFSGTEYHANHAGYLGFGLNYAVIRNISGELRQVLCLSIHDVFQKKDICKEFCKERGGNWAPHPQKFWYVPLSIQKPKNEEDWRKVVVECLEIADRYLKEVGSMSMRRKEERFISVYEGTVVEILKEEIENFGQPRPQTGDAVLGGKSVALKYEDPVSISSHKMKKLGGQQNYEGDWIFPNESVRDRALLECLQVEDAFWKSEYNDPNSEAGDLDAVERRWANCTACIRELECALGNLPVPAPKPELVSAPVDDRSNYQKLVDRFISAGNSEATAKKGALKVLDAASEYLPFEEIAHQFNATHHEFIKQIMVDEKARIRIQEQAADEIADRYQSEVTEIQEQLDFYCNSPLNGSPKQQSWAQSIRGFAVENWLARAVVSNEMSFDEAVDLVKNPDARYWIDNRKKWGSK